MKAKATPKGRMNSSEYHMSVDEIADSIGMSRARVTQLIDSGLRKLRRNAEALGFDASNLLGTHYEGHVVQPLIRERPEP